MSFSFLSRGKFVSWVFLLAFLLCACGQSPEGTAEAYLRAVAENRVEDAINFYSLKDVRENDLTTARGKLQMIIGEQYSRIKARGGLKSLTTNLVEQEGNEAKVEVEIRYENGDTEKANFRLTKESGDWKLHLQ
jgi:hypothetical protein